MSLAGETRTIAMEPILKFQMKGLGYGHPEWGQGMWKGEQAFGHESFDPRQLDLLAAEPACSRWSSRRRQTGIGVLEQIVAGPTRRPDSRSSSTAPRMTAR